MKKVISNSIENGTWAITTYYNPCNYKKRLENYKMFRRNLKIPLLTVELSFSEKHELQTDDADLLIQLKGDSIMWQKERLLNVGLHNLPQHVKNVVWIDCDVIIGSNDWIEKTIEILETKKIVQLFSKLFDLKKDENPTNIDAEVTNPSGYSISYLTQSEILIKNDFQPTSTAGMRRAAFGLAWAAKRNLLDKFKFYDSMILGSGDRALACAGFGKFEDFISTAHLNINRTNHYLKWATSFHNEIKGDIAYIDNNLFHLWHGDLINRKYLERHIEFNSFDFNPNKDIIIGANGCWNWNTNNLEMVEYVKNYFSYRLEDGIV